LAICGLLVQIKQQLEQQRTINITVQEKQNIDIVGLN
jgi:hypothetical protein